MLLLAEEKNWIVDHLLFTHPFQPLNWIGLGWVGDFIGLSSHVLSMFVVAAIMLWLFPKVAREQGLVPTGLGNFLEVILLFIRDEVAKPFLGHNANKFLPVLWTFFFFILLSNLMGLVPGMATATGKPFVTGTLALIAFFFWHASGMWEQGVLPYLKNIVPPGLPLWLIPLMLVVEIVGHVAKPFALTIRLAANMTGGHAVLYGFLGLIFIFESYYVGPVSVAFATGVYLLEILVAFIQAYVFTFLVTVFLGAAVHPEH
jgi:F-type H+-transporting ATPase subunit a